MPIDIEGGLALIEAAQSLGVWLQTPMVFFSLLGIAPFYMLIMPALLWCYDAELGLRVGFILLVSAALNVAFKLWLAQPRPYWLSEQVVAHSHEPSFGLPSGHAQNAVAVWGRLALGLRRRWAYVSAAFLIALISFSRIYLGVHFPHDVLAGLVAGGLILVGALGVERWLESRARNPSLSVRLLQAGSLSVMVLALGLMAWDQAQAIALPAAWGETALAVSGQPIDPLNLEDLFTATGALLGLGLGAVLLKDWGGFDAGGPWSQRLTRYGLGISVVLALYAGLGALAPEEPQLSALGWRYLRYALIGFWISYGAPRTFARVKLIPTDARS